MSDLVVIIAILVLGGVALGALLLLNRHDDRADERLATVERSMGALVDWQVRAKSAENYIERMMAELRWRREQMMAIPETPTDDLPAATDTPPKRRISRKGATGGTGETATIATTTQVEATT